MTATNTAAPPTADDLVVARLPRGSGCQCTAEGCGLIFSGESAFERHWTRLGHVHPARCGLVEHPRAAGTVWGCPGRKPAIAAGVAEEGPKLPSGHSLPQEAAS